MGADLGIKNLNHHRLKYFISILLLWNWLECVCCRNTIAYIVVKGVAYTQRQFSTTKSISKKVNSYINLMQCNLIDALEGLALYLFESDKAAILDQT